MFVAGADGDLMLGSTIDSGSGGSGEVWAIHRLNLQADLYTGLVDKEVLHLTKHITWLSCAYIH